MGYGVAFGTSLFRPAYGPGRELQIQTAPLEAPSFDTRSNPEELNEEFGRTFARDDFTGGEGLDFAHTRAERVNRDTRFFDSKNIDAALPAPGQPREVTLLRATTKVINIAAGRVRAAWDGTTLYVTNGNTFATTVNPTATPVVTAASDPHAGEAASTVWDVIYLGTTVYAALGGNGIHRRTSGGAWAHWSDIPATRIWNAKSRVIAAVDTALYEAVAGAAPTPLYTLPAGRTWKDVCDAGDAILAAADDGNIYAFAPDATTAVLRLIAQSPIEGEQPTALGYAQGYVFYATAEQETTGRLCRLWRAQLTEGLALGDAQLLREWPGVTGLGRIIRRILAVRDSVYVAVPESASETDVWRYDLAAAALFRSFVVSSSNAEAADALLTISGRLFIGLEDYGIARQSATAYATSGYLIGPLGDFFTSAVKSWVAASLDADDLPTVADGRTVTLFYSTDPDALTDATHASWTQVAQWDTDSDVSGSDLPLSGVESRYIAGKVVLTPNAAASSAPVFRSFGFRAVPGGGGGPENVDKVVQVPINVSDQLERANKRRGRVKGWGRQVYTSLRQFEGEALTMTLYLPGETITMRGLVESVGAPVQVSAERGSATAYAMVKFRGREVA